MVVGGVTAKNPLLLFFLFVSGSISRTADGRLVSARQLHSILHVMNGAQFHAAMLPQMQALHVPWNMQKAEQVLHTFYTKFQKVNTNDID